jgi:hypothetical protein
MRRTTLAVLSLLMGLLLSACFEEPTLKADTEANFDTSYAILTKDLSSADGQKLDAALKDIVLVEVGMYGPMLDAKSYQPPSGQTDTPFGQAFAKGFTGAMTAALNQGLAANWNGNRAKLVVENARALVDGHTAKEILAIAESERKKAVETTLAIYRDQLTKAQSALNDVRAGAEAAQRKRAEQQLILQGVGLTAFLYQRHEEVIAYVRPDPAVTGTG